MSNITNINQFETLLDSKKAKESAVFKVVDNKNIDSFGETKESTLHLENFSFFKRLRLRMQALLGSRFQKNARIQNDFTSTIIVTRIEESADGYRKAVMDYQKLFLAKYGKIEGGEDLLKKIAPAQSRFLRKSDLQKYASQISALEQKTPTQLILPPPQKKVSLSSSVKINQPPKRRKGSQKTSHRSTLKRKKGLPSSSGKIKTLEKKNTVESKLALSLPSSKTKPPEKIVMGSHA